MTHSKHRGHPIEFTNSTWIYSDNKQPVSSEPNRSCGNCGKSQTEHGHDGCIGTLPGVMNACCGHGSDDEAYIQYENGKELRGEEALSEMSKQNERSETDKIGMRRIVRDHEQVKAVEMLIEHGFCVSKAEGRRVFHQLRKKQNEVKCTTCGDSGL